MTGSNGKECIGHLEKLKQDILYMRNEAERIF
jgi:hypothetical protein